MLPKKHRHRATIQGTSHRNIHTSLSRSTSSINVTSPIILSININSPTTLSISISISSIQHRLLPIQLEMKGTNNTGKEVAITSRHSLKGMVMNKAIVNIASIVMVMSINTSMNMDMGTVMVVTMTN